VRGRMSGQQRAQDRDPLVGHRVDEAADGDGDTIAPTATSGQVTETIPITVANSPRHNKADENDIERLSGRTR